MSAARWGGWGSRAVPGRDRRLGSRGVRVGVGDVGDRSDAFDGGVEGPAPRSRLVIVARGGERTTGIGGDPLDRGGGGGKARAEEGCHK